MSLPAGAVVLCMPGGGDREQLRARAQAMLTKGGLGGAYTVLAYVHDSDACPLGSRREGSCICQALWVFILPVGWAEPGPETPTAA